jgi:hypothetical protein
MAPLPSLAQNYHLQHIIYQLRDVGAPQPVRLPAELLQRIDRYSARLEAELLLSASRSDAP